MRDYIHDHGSLSFTCSGRSMGPAMPSGSIAEIERLPDTVLVGDLLVWIRSGAVAMCCHRVIAVSQTGAVVTRGDGNAWPDGWIERSRQIGVVRSYWVGGKRYAALRHGRPEQPSAYRRLRARMAGWLHRQRTSLSIA